MDNTGSPVTSFCGAWPGEPCRHMPASAGTCDVHRFVASLRAQLDERTRDRDSLRARIEAREY